MLADVRLTDAPDGVLSINAADDCFAFVAPFGDGWYRVFAWDRQHPSPTPRRSTSTRSATSPAGPSAPTSACTTRAGCPLPLRRAAGHPLPGRPGVPGRRRRARAHAGRRSGHEHRHPGRGQPRLEAGRRPAGRRPGRPAGQLPRRAAPCRPHGAAQQRCTDPARHDPVPGGAGRPQQHRQRRPTAGPGDSQGQRHALGHRHPVPDPGRRAPCGRRAGPRRPAHRRGERSGTPLRGAAQRWLRPSHFVRHRPAGPGRLGQPGTPGNRGRRNRHRPTDTPDGYIAWASHKADAGDLSVHSSNGAAHHVPDQSTSKPRKPVCRTASWAECRRPRPGRSSRRLQTHWHRHIAHQRSWP